MYPTEYTQIQINTGKNTETPLGFTETPYQAGMKIALTGAYNHKDKKYYVRESATGVIASVRKVKIVVGSSGHPESPRFQKSSDTSEIEINLENGKREKSALFILPDDRCVVVSDNEMDRINRDLRYDRGGYKDHW